VSDRGPQGSPGPSGPQGIEGPQGPEGVSGTGKTGRRGFSGVPGIRGKTGHLPKSTAISFLVFAFVLAAMFAFMGWRLLVAQQQRELICTNQIYIQVKLARLVELAAPTHRKLGREAVYQEFLRTAKELKERTCEQ
jgi:hypothetical protein